MLVLVVKGMIWLWGGENRDGKTTKKFVVEKLVSFYLPLVDVAKLRYIIMLVNFTNKPSANNGWS